MAANSLARWLGVVVVVGIAAALTCGAAIDDGNDLVVDGRSSSVTDLLSMGETGLARDDDIRSMHGFPLYSLDRNLYRPSPVGIDRPCFVPDLSTETLLDSLFDFSDFTAKTIATSGPYSPRCSAGILPGRSSSSMSPGWLELDLDFLEVADLDLILSDLGVGDDIQCEVPTSVPASIVTHEPSLCSSNGNPLLMGSGSPFLSPCTDSQCNIYDVASQDEYDAGLSEIPLNSFRSGAELTAIPQAASDPAVIPFDKTDNFTHDAEETSPQERIEEHPVQEGPVSKITARKRPRRSLGRGPSDKIAPGGQSKTSSKSRKANDASPPEPSPSDFCAFDLPERFSLRLLTTAEAKLDVLKAIADKAQGVPIETWSAELWRFLKQTFVPVRRCLQLHHGGDVAAFARHWGDPFPHHRFPCSGQATTCLPPRLPKHQRKPATEPPEWMAIEWMAIDFSKMKELQSDLTTREKLDIIQGLYARIEELPFPVRSTFAHYHYVQEVLRPVVKCYREHCGSKLDEFERRWGERFPHYQFSRQRCPGPKWIRTPNSGKAADAGTAADPSRKRSKSSQLGPVRSGGDSRGGPVRPEAVCGWELLSASSETNLVEVEPCPDLGSADPVTQIKQIRQYLDGYRDLNRNQITRTSYNRLIPLRAVIGCLENHCGNNVDAFTRRWPQFDLQTFSKTCCTGSERGVQFDNQCVALQKKKTH